MVVPNQRYNVNGNIPRPNPNDNQNVMPNYVHGGINPLPPQPPPVIEGIPVDQPANGQSEFHVYGVNQPQNQCSTTNGTPNIAM